MQRPADPQKRQHKRKASGSEPTGSKSDFWDLVGRNLWCTADRARKDTKLFFSRAAEGNPFGLERQPQTKTIANILVFKLGRNVDTSLDEQVRAWEEEDR